MTTAPIVFVDLSDEGDRSRMVQVAHVVRVDEIINGVAVYTVDGQVFQVTRRFTNAEDVMEALVDPYLRMIERDDTILSGGEPRD